MGERTPHMDPLYRGAFLGLNTVHTQAHMLRAIMEGVVFCLADCNDLLKDQGIEITSLRACGGGSTSPVYRKMLADLFRCGIHTLANKEGGAAFGAAILAGVAPEFILLYGKPVINLSRSRIPWTSIRQKLTCTRNTMQYMIRCMTH